MSSNKGWTAGPRKRTEGRSLPPVSETLVAVRLEARMTQKQAAKAIGVSPVTLSRIEGGDLRISARNLEKILNFYDLTLGALPRGAGDGAQAGGSQASGAKDPYPKW